MSILEILLVVFALVFLGIILIFVINKSDNIQKVKLIITTLLFSWKLQIDRNKKIVQKIIENKKTLSKIQGVKGNETDKFLHEVEIKADALMGKLSRSILKDNRVARIDIPIAIFDSFREVSKKLLKNDEIKIKSQEELLKVAGDIDSMYNSPPNVYYTDKLSLKDDFQKIFSDLDRVKYIEGPIGESIVRNALLAQIAYITSTLKILFLAAEIIDKAKEAKTDKK